ncbi:hypothetical protein CEXT_97361 [Caerostris extrusa]|uniref:Uncharacterized protein n=1 Tax=Caerostris extrusa TaxID=172846 RepID=A0AAV4M8C5_CAEEX|nr:hypothetical protein CEXT_97361 [Caerostris extrusa]
MNARFPTKKIVKERKVWFVNQHVNQHVNRYVEVEFRIKSVHFSNMMQTKSTYNSFLKIGHDNKAFKSISTIYDAKQAAFQVHQQKKMPSVPPTPVDTSATVTTREKR